MPCPETQRDFTHISRNRGEAFTQQRPAFVILQLNPNADGTKECHSAKGQGVRCASVCVCLCESVYMCVCVHMCILPEW